MGKGQRSEVGSLNKRDEWMNRMIPAGWDDSLCEGWVPSELGMTPFRRDGFAG